MMDEMKIKLSTKLMRGFVAKLLSKAISKKLDCKVSLDLNEIDIATVGDEIHIHANVDSKFSKEDFAKIIKAINTD